MKLTLRIVALLAAALVVTGALLAFGRSSFGEAMRAQGPRGHEHGHFEGAAGRPEGFEGRPEGRPEGFEGRGRGEDHGPSLFGLSEVFGNLVKIGVIVAVLAIGARLLSLVRDRSRRDPPPAPPSTGETSRL